MGGRIHIVKKALANPRRAFEKLVQFARGERPYWYFRLISDSEAEAYGRLRGHQWGRLSDDELESRVEGAQELQFPFMKQRGLEPEDRLLDIGCGYLRGGIWFIDYLAAGNYTGMDISEEVIEIGRQLLDQELLNKNPTLIVNDDLTFSELESESFEYALAQSVFSHLNKTDIMECLTHLDRVLVDDGAFYATFFDAEQHTFEDSSIMFAYEREELEDIAAQTGWEVAFIDEKDYPHDSQRMAEFIPKTNGDFE